jgi:hypothetical protein
MKKKLLLFMIFHIFFLRLTAQVAWYPLNNNVNDASGNGNNGTVINGAAPVNDRYANSNNAYSFNGSNQYLNVPNSSSLQITGTVSISAWIKRNRFDIDIILEKGGDWTTGSCNYGIAMHNVNNNMFYFYYNGGGRGTDGVNDFNWHHYAVVATNGDADPALYIDGVARPVNYSFGSSTISLFASAADLHIGAQVGLPYYSQNTIDEVKIYNTALSANQVLDEYYRGNKRAGSGNALNCPGSDAYLSFNTTGYTGISTYTIECWLYKNSPNTANHVFESNTAGAPSLESSGNPNGSLNFWVGNSSSLNTGALAIGKWYHIACVYDKTNTLQQLYVNGVLMNSVNVDVADIIGPNMGFMARAYVGLDKRSFNGVVDEIRIWNIPLNAAQIRERMCSKINPADPLYANLMGYYRFDIDPGTAANDLKGINNAVLTNNPAWVSSGAAIGDASSYNYSAMPAASLTSPEGENFTATTSSGFPDGIHIYRVDHRPEITGPGIGGNDRYFGVFSAGGTSPQYNAVYNYTGNPFVGGSNENNLVLLKRDNNASPSWTDALALLNTATNTLTVSGQNTEYILALSSGALPVSFLSFTARQINTAIELKWSTATEQNSRGFEIQKSENGIHFSVIGFVNGKGSNNSIQQYSFIDSRPAKGTNYYRLKQIDFDEKSSFSPVRQVKYTDENIYSLHPNPAKDKLVIEIPARNTSAILISDVTGRIVWQSANINSSVIEISVSPFTSGLYIVQFVGSNGRISLKKFLKH